MPRPGNFESFQNKALNRLRAAAALKEGLHRAAKRILASRGGRLAIALQLKP